MAVAFSLDTGP